MNIERSTYSYYESGKTFPDLKTLMKLAEIFKEPLSSFLPNEEKGLVFCDSGGFDIFNKADEVLEDSYNKYDHIVTRYSLGDIFENDNYIMEQNRDIDDTQEDNGEKNADELDLMALSEDEKQMIVLFRSLPSDSQRKVKNIILERAKEENRVQGKFDLF